MTISVRDTDKSLAKYILHLPLSLLPHFIIEYNPSLEKGYKYLVLHKGRNTQAIEKKKQQKKNSSLLHYFAKTDLTGSEQ